MPSVAPATAYYLNRELAAVALIVQGVRFPPGVWIRVADQGALARVEGLIGNQFPELKGKVLALASLTNEDDVKAFERRAR